MNRIAAWGFSALVAIAVLTALFTRQHVTSTHHSIPVAAVPTAQSPPATVPGEAASQAEEPDGDESEAVIDLYGNDVSPAVATYSFDELGSLYEVHSPQTELPRLGSPKT